MTGRTDPTGDAYNGLIERAHGFLAAGEDYRRSSVVLFGAPLDVTTSFRPGAYLGPRRIREASSGIEEYSWDLDHDLRETTFTDLGDAILPLGNLAGSLEAIKGVAGRIVADGHVPFMLGGEHLVTLPAVEAVLTKYPQLAVLHFDAHADLRDNYLGERLSHATAIRRVAELLPPKSVAQFGIRSGDKEELVFAKANTLLFREGPAASVKAAIREFRGRPIYVTFDIDAFDPAYAPGTGTPEPGGFTPREVFDSLYAMRESHRRGEVRIVGLDLVEVAPTLDSSERTAILAAKLIREAILCFGR
ncbi:MAG: agmatinase [Bacillota bacterium]